MTDSKELFRALELAHYAERFRDKVFVIALPAEETFGELLVDFRVLAAYRIQVVLVARDPVFRLEELIAVANKRGAGFRLSLLTDLLFQPGEKGVALDFDKVRDTLRRGQTPVISYHGPLEATAEGVPEPEFLLGAALARRLGAQKLFLVTPLAGPLRKALPRSSVQAGEMEGLPATLEQAGLREALPLCSFIRTELEAGAFDVVLLEGHSAHLFREVFTYDGAGVLFNLTRQARTRRAELRDVTDIALLLRPEVEAGRILPIGENRIEANIHNYWIYEIDGMAVGVACLKRHGTEAELAQFATLPRYRGKGRARELALALAEQALAQGCRRVFALSIDARMWEFFLSLGFVEVDRAALPEEWRRGYDMSRPSRAFLKEL
jgi:N-acetylglutamate synthase-like GNAT family acetyltransferase